MARTLTQAAQAAKAIKQELYATFPGIEFSVKSSNYSMGSSVDVYYTDGPTTKEIEALTGKYQYGHFNGMTDMYEVSNSRDDIPQAKFVSVNRKMSEDVAASLIGELIVETHEPNLTIDGYCFSRDLRVSCIIREKFFQKSFYNHKKPKPEPEPETETETEIDTGFEIAETKHFKKGYPLWVVSLVNRIPREAFNALSDNAKLLGGWYSYYKANGAIPGFQFKQQTAAELFVYTDENIQLAHTASDPEPPKPKNGKPQTGNETPQTGNKTAQTGNSKAVPDLNAMEKWKKLADSYQKEADKKHAELQHALRNTPKRQREYCSKVVDADTLADKATAAKGLATLYSLGLAPKIIAKLAPVKAKDPLNPFVRGYEVNTSDYCAYRSNEIKYQKWGDKVQQMCGLTKAEADEIFKLLQHYTNGGNNEERERQNRINRLIDKVRFSQIDGFFPTPDDLIDRMIDEARIQETDIILEPSAGIGSIPDRIRERGYSNKIYTCEINHTLSEILEEKGWSRNQHDDFLNTEYKVDKILMNPPFERWMDIDHVQHAYNCLNPGGRLVSIMGAGAFNGSMKKHKQFAEWLFTEVGGTAESLPEGAFKSAFRSTGVRTYIVVIDKE